MKIEKSTEWENLRGEIVQQVRSLNYNPDIRKMIKNIDGLVTNLSKLEVEARRTKRDYYLKQPLEEINTALATLDQFITLAHLLQ
jgi:hypothetical protein